jgi:hypothetical protein
VSAHWADLIQNHIESSFIAPAEALLEAAQLSRAVQVPPMNRIPQSELSALGILPPPAVPLPLSELPPLLPAAPGQLGREVELTFEIVQAARPPEAP